MATANGDIGTPLQSHIAEPIAPLWKQLAFFTWGKYDEAEKALHRHIRVSDYLGGLVMTVAYLLAAWCASGDPVVLPETPPLVLFLQVCCAALGLFTIYLHIFSQPNPTKREAEIYGCLSGPCGRWIFLTRQTLALQAVHLFASLVSPFCSRSIATGTYALAVYVGGQATFVTIQFFTLVFPQAEYKKACETWAARGVYFKLIGKLTHTPGLCLMIADICLCKNRNALRNLTLSVPVMMFIILGYTVLYIGQLFANNGITGHWPYSFLYKFQGACAWIKFVIVQYAILLALTFSVLAISRYVPPLW